MQHKLYGLRGKAYVEKYKQLYEELKDDIKKDVQEVKVRTGEFSFVDFGALCMKYQLPTTAMDDFLNSIFPSWTAGTWERARQSGRKASDIGVKWD